MNITLDLRIGEVNNGVDRLKDTIPRMGPDDELTIIVEATDAHETDGVIDELEKNGFDYQPKGSNDGNLYNIIARRHLLH